MKYFACINNPSTDQKQQIQVCEIKNNSVEKNVSLDVKTDSFLEEIYCINNGFIFSKDNIGKFWRLKIK
jgi:hypothetical protein